MAVTDEIQTRLEAAFRPRRLSVEDESESHRGHAGWREGGETHFAVTMEAEDFGPLSRLERHRAVHSALGPDLIARIHALRLTLSA
ncbi:BolA family transcriptional regulator [Haematobacter massiliensis]|uniref:BolA family transcriptional regulator n=1 Tax=Haematobacter massiliensis TaxID=195105 RepID=A0A086YB34_9RHOB|nr:BolA family protein [Haematobacter massiliensis]KFI31484.1 BolA family transcriptional regulator [Haematobacter massiliensis]OWJ71618.1 BolA family transcriptional regulator [Haematobacter massiliensis]OWJ88056.1 BolA family transcriptional regulator [Haematobacter massiliensis]QBJ23562.1 BolA family transcriptional regulator [Haematobacter massiliensis]